MAANEIHVSDIGTVLRCTIKDNGVVVDVSGATVKLLLFKPDGTLVSKTPSYVTNGTDGKVQYAVQSGDLDQNGVWKLQAFVDFGSTEFYSDIAEFRVYSNIGVA